MEQHNNPPPTSVSPLIIFLIAALPFLTNIVDELVPSSRPWIKYVRVKRFIYKDLVDITYGAIIVICLYFSLVLAVGVSTFKAERFSGATYGSALAVATGTVAIMNFWLVVLPSAKCRIMCVEGSEGIGLPFDRAIKYHQVVGFFAILSATVHLTVNSVENSTVLYDTVLKGSIVKPVFGYVAFIMACLMAWTAVEPFRRLRYEVFQRVHHLYVLVIIFIILHVNYAILGFIPGIIYHGIDQCNKLYAYLTPKKLIMASTSNSLASTSIDADRNDILTIRVSIDRYNPQVPGLGSYYFINAPMISKFQWHPFSVSSYDAPSSTVTFHIKAMEEGSFSDKFYKFALQQEILAQVQDNVSHIAAVRGQVALYGPYGNLSVNLELYKHIVLVAGGIGITPMWLILDDIIKFINRTFNTKAMKKAKSSLQYVDLQKITLLWVYRGDDIAELFTHNLPTGTTFASPSLGVDQSLGQTISMDYFLYNTGSYNKENPAALTLNRQFHAAGNLTQVKIKVKSKDKTTSLRKDGRPDLTKFFQQLDPASYSNTCVVACGPAGLTKQTKGLANLYGIDIHTEAFEL